MLQRLQMYDDYVKTSANAARILRHKMVGTLHLVDRRQRL